MRNGNLEGCNRIQIFFNTNAQTLGSDDHKFEAMLLDILCLSPQDLAYSNSVHRFTALGGPSEQTQIEYSSYIDMPITGQTDADG